MSESIKYQLARLFLENIIISGFVFVIIWKLMDAWLAYFVLGFVMATAFMIGQISNGKQNFGIMYGVVLVSDFLFWPAAFFRRISKDFDDHYNKDS